MVRIVPLDYYYLVGPWLLLHSGPHTVGLPNLPTLPHLELLWAWVDSWRCLLPSLPIPWTTSHPIPPPPLPDYSCLPLGTPSHNPYTPGPRCAACTHPMPFPYHHLLYWEEFLNYSFFSPGLFFNLPSLWRRFLPRRDETGLSIPLRTAGGTAMGTVPYSHSFLTCLPP